MALMRITSPHAHGPLSTQQSDADRCLLAAVPGILVLTHFFGFGTLVNILWAVAAGAVAFEALALQAAQAPCGLLSA